MEAWVPRPADVVGARDAILRRIAEPGGSEWFRYFCGDRDQTDAFASDVWPRLQHCLSHSALYLVTEPMGHVLVEATATLPGYIHDWHDEPAPWGLVVFQAPMAPVATVVDLPTLPIRGLSWQPMWFKDESGPETSEQLGEGWPGLAIVQWVATADLAATVAELQGNTAAAEELQSSQPPLMAFTCDPWPIGWAWDDERLHPTIDGQPNPTRFNSGLLAAFFRIVGEEWADGGTVHPTRPERRRALRAGTPDPSPVRVVTLRRAAQQQAEAPARRDATWRHQWIVRGHWRNQWYPSQGRHAPKFIPEYVKGPEGAPLLDRPVVGVLRR